MNDSPDALVTPAFKLLADSASSVAPQTDLLLTAMLLLCGGVAIGLAVLIVWFSVRYRKGSKADRSHPPSNARGLEAAWTIAPLLIFLGVFGWAARDFIELYRPPADALPIYVVGKQWMWTLQHRNGRREIDQLHVPLGEPVRLIMTSQDVIHSFFVPAFRLKQDVLPGRYTSLWFKATQLGEFHLFCAEFCGAQHSAMIGKVVVMQPADYARWLQAGPNEPSLAQTGFSLFRSNGCSGCHAAGSTVHAPSLDGLFGRTVHLQDGRSVLADENYLRDSMLQPAKDVVAGFAAIMPSFAGQLSEEDIQALIAYVRSTTETKTGNASRSLPVPQVPGVTAGATR
ncbi:MAG: coxB [Rhizobacter sp.]|nr:coxB [Rhizobacter sp.]